MSELDAFKMNHDLNHNLLKNGKSNDISAELNDLSLESKPKVQCNYNSFL